MDEPKGESLNKCEQDESDCHTFEEAIALIGHGKFHYLHIIVVGLCLMAFMCETMGVSFLLTTAKCDLSLTLAEQGLIGASGFIGIVISSYFWGLFADLWGRHLALRVSITCSIVVSVISAFSVSFWMLAVTRFCVGCFISACQACAYSYLGEFHGRTTRARAVSFVTMFLPLGLLYIPAIAIGILPLKIEGYIIGIKFASWRLFAMCCSLPTLVAVIVLPFFPESPKYLLVHHRREQALKVLQNIYKWNTQMSQERYPVKYLLNETAALRLDQKTGFRGGLFLIWSQTAPLFYKSRILDTTKFLFLSTVVYGVAHGMFIWIPNIMNIMFTYMESGMTICEAIERRKGLNHSNSRGNATASQECDSYINPNAYVAIMVGSMTFIVIYLIIGGIVNRVGKKRLLVIWTIVTGICGIGLCLSRNLWVSVLLAIVFLSLGNCGGLLNAIAVEYYPTQYNAMAMCLVVIFGRFGDIAGNNIIAAMISSDCNSLFYSFGAATLICAIISYFLPGSFQQAG